MLPPRAAVASWIISLVLCEQALAGTLSSYAVSAQDVTGSTGAASVALGPPDYVFVNDVTAGGSNSDVFGVGESATFTFSAPLRDVPGHDDLFVSAYVGGSGASDNAQVRVEGSTDGVNFVVLDTFDTQDARLHPQEGAFDGVKHFLVEFGGLDGVTDVRLTNLSGTAEGLRLDAVEGLHPSLNSPHAFEFRIERYRLDASERFLIRIKNLSDPNNGVPLTGFSIGRNPDPNTGYFEWMEETDNNLVAINGLFFATVGSVGDADDPNVFGVPFAQWEWSIDGGLTVAPPGVGLAPGERSSHRRWENLDVDAGGTFLAGFEFSVFFDDGFVHEFDWDNDVSSFPTGQLYQKYTYFSSTPSLTGPRPSFHYEFVQGSAAPVPALRHEALLLTLVCLLGGYAALRHRRGRTRGPGS